MRKIPALFLSAVLCFLLAGCGQQAAAPDQSHQLEDLPELPRKPGSETVLSTVEAPATVSVGEMFTSRDYNTGYSDYVTVLLADGASAADGEGVSISGSTVTVTKSGTYVFTGTLSDGQIVVDIGDTEKAQIVLDNADVTCSGSAALLIRSGDKVFLTTAYQTENSFTSKGSFSDKSDEKVDGAIFARSDLTLNGGGSLTVTAQNGNGIVTKDDLKICSGTYSVTAGNHGLEGKNSVRISGGSLEITSKDDGIHSDNTKDGKGFVYICGGRISVDSGDDGIHAASSLTVCGGELDVVRSVEGLEALTISISGGAINIVSSDDGLNASASGGAETSMFGGFGVGRNDPFASDEGAGIFISGGKLTVNAEGDGIDSNGSLWVSGGEVYISGPTNGGDGALDYETTGYITGGTVIAACAEGMAENFDYNSTQGTILYSLPSSEPAGTEVTVTDAEGAVLARYTPEKAYKVVVVSAPGMAAGGKYTVTCGKASESIELSSTVYGSGGMMPGMGGGPGGFGGGQNGIPSGFGGGQNGGPGEAPGDRPEDPPGEMPGMGGGPGGFGGRK